MFIRMHERLRFLFRQESQPVPGQLPSDQTAAHALRPVPQFLRDNHISIDEARLGQIERSIRENYHTGWRSEANYSAEAYQEDLNSHLNLRLIGDRLTVVPWLAAAQPLRDQRVLEIGCGTGSSTVALAEQGAKVLGVDIDEGALAVARDRCIAYGVTAEFRSLNADRILEAFVPGSFDTIIYFAALEHMTIAERLKSLGSAWAMLASGGLLVIIETPNRLWYEDGHTALLPFYHWLPNELAFHYSHLSHRGNFKELYREYDAPSKHHFLRRGRGMSFHELDLAIAPAKGLEVVSSLRSYDPVSRGPYSRLACDYKAILERIYPDIHSAFFDEYLDIIIRKN